MSATPPCVRCGTLHGIAWQTQRAGVDPRRADGTHYGFPGPHCYECFWAIRCLGYAAACAECETTEGYVPPGQSRPARRSVERDGEMVLVCQACYQGHRAAALVERGTARRLRGRRLGGPPRATEGGLDLTAILPRVAVIRAVKRRRYAMGFDTDLTPELLDRLLPPVDCQRTRQRLSIHEPEGHPGPVVPVPAAAGGVLCLPQPRFHPDQGATP